MRQETRAWRNTIGAGAATITASGTPRDIVAKLNHTLVAAGRSRRVIDQLTAVSMVSVTNSPEEFTAFIRADIVKWGKVVKAAGAPLD